MLADFRRNPSAYAKAIAAALTQLVSVLLIWNLVDADTAGRLNETLLIITNIISGGITTAAVVAIPNKRHGRNVDKHSDAL